MLDNWINITFNPDGNGTLAPWTDITITSIDVGVGLNDTLYRIWDGGNWTAWQSYNGTFSLSNLADGDYIIEVEASEV